MKRERTIMKFKSLKYIYFMIMTIACLSFMFNNSIAGADNGDNIYITRPNFVAAVTQPLLKEAMKYLLISDYRAFKQLLATGHVFELKPNARVYLEKITFGGLVKIRLVGTTTAIWTLKEAIGL